MIIIMTWTLYSVPAKQKHVIGSWPGGFFSAMCSTLAHIAWATANNRIPVVYWGRESLYYQPEGYNGSYNVWEYYFEPLNDEQYQPGDRIHTTYCMGMHCINGFKMHSHAEKKWVNGIINQHVRIKENIKNKIETFFDGHMKDKVTIGIHLRGTDKQTEIAMPQPIRLIDEANKIAQVINADQFFVATDEERLLELAKNTLCKPIVYYDSFRSVNGKPIHKKIEKALRGEEVLIETLLLSQCNWFVHSHSNVAYFVMFFNPDMHDTFIEYRF